MYISSGRVVPTLVQNTSSRGPGVVGCALSARSTGSGCLRESLFTPVRARRPRMRPPPEAVVPRPPPRPAGAPAAPPPPPRPPPRAPPPAPRRRCGHPAGPSRRARRGGVAAATASARSPPAPAPTHRRVLVPDALGVRAAVALELRLDPVHGRAIAVRPLPAVAPLRHSLDRGLVALEFEPPHEHL